MPLNAVFLSYASQDAAAAQRIAEALREAGIEVWFDRSELKGGAAWDAEIRRQIHECALFVPIISASTEQRMEGYFRLEWRLAEQRTHLMAKGMPFLVPVVIDETRDAEAHVPDTFLDVQWTPLSGGHGAHSFAAQVKRLLAQALVPPTMSGRSTRSTAPASPTKKPDSRQRLYTSLIIGTIVVALAFVSAQLSLFGLRAGRAQPAVGTASDSPPPVAAAPTPAAPRTAVAVLPFANLTGDPGKDYLGDGMAEELINTLAKVSGLKVPARTSAFAYKGRNVNIRDIAADLHVGTVLEGSVRAAGKRLRITAQLVSAEDGLNLWSETYDEPFNDIFKLQQKLATQIASALQPNLTDVQKGAVAQGPPTKDIEAYSLYLRALAVPTGAYASLQQAIAFLQQAIGRDPKFAAAYAHLALMHLIASEIEDTADHLRASERAARQALALEPATALAHAVLSSLADDHGQLLEMEANMRRALALDASNPNILVGRAFQQLEVGYLRAMQQTAFKAYTLAPAALNAIGIHALAEWHAGHTADAERLQQVMASLGFTGRSVFSPPAARQALPGVSQEIRRLYASAAPGSDQARAAEVFRLVQAALDDPSRRGDALAARTRLFPRPAAAAAHAPLVDAAPCLASSWSYAMLGSLDEAFDLAGQCLDRMVPGRTLSSGAFGIGGLWAPEMRAFRQDPRFQSLVTRLGLMEYWQMYGPPDDCELKSGTLTCQ